MLQLFYYGQVFGSTPLILNDNVDNYKLSKNISYFEDKKNNLTFNQILNSSSIQQKFSSLPGYDTNLGLSHSTFWFRLEIRNGQKEKFLLHLVSQKNEQ